MATRTVTVNLTARVAQLEEAMAAAASATQQVGEAAEAATSQSARGFSGLANHLRANQAEFDKLTNGIGIAGAALVGVAALGVAKFAEFDQQMSYVAAATHASAEEMTALRNAAMVMGADSVFSAKEAAQGIEELAKAGVSTADILKGGLKGSLDLAAAGGIGVGEAAETASSAMVQFGLEGDKVTHIADLLSAGAGKAQGSVGDLSQALKQGGLVAASTGLSIEETTGGLAAFASAGLLGSDAGTSFKTMLMRLNPSSKEAAGMFEQLGINAYDSSGQFVGLANFAGQLQTKMADLTPEARNAALSVMFGSDAVRAANILYQQGQSGITDWIGKVNDSGYAAETAAMRLDNLAGDWEAFTGALDTALINSGQGSSSLLRNVVQQATEAVDAFGRIPGPVQSALGMGTGIAGMSLLAVAGMGKMFTGISETKAAMTALGFSNKAAAITFGALGAAVAIATIAVGNYLQNQAKVTDATKQLEGSADALKQTLAPTSTDTFLKILKEDVSAQDLDRVFQKTGISAQEMAAALTAGGSQLETLRTKLASFHDADDFAEGLNPFGDGAAAYAAVGGMIDSVNRLSDARQETIAKAVQQAAEEQKAAAALAGASDAGSSWAAVQKDIADRVNGSTAAMEESNAAYAEQLENLDAVTNAALGWYGAQTNLGEAQAKLNEALKTATGNTDASTEAGRKNRETIQGLVKDYADHRKVMIDSGHVTEESKAQLDSYGAGITALLQKLGASPEEIKAFHDTMTQPIPVPDTSGVDTALLGIAEKAQKAAQGVSDSFGETEIEAHFGADTTKFTGAFAGVWADTQKFAGYLAAAGVDITDEGFTAKMDTAQQRLAFFELQKPAAARVDMDPSLLQTVYDNCMALLADLSLQTPTPELRATMDQLSAVAAAAAEELNKPKQNAPASIQAVDETGAARDSATFSLNAPKQNAPASITAQDNTGPASAQANSSVNAPKQNAPASITAQNNTGPGVNSAIGGLNSVPATKTTVLTTVYRRTFETSGVPFAPDRWANGGIVETYAAGGVREDHTAQIAAAGTMRLWAEPETGGEAYIPLAAAKRQRSEAILAQVAKRFGGSFQKFAAGGFDEAGWLKMQQDRSNASGEKAFREFNILDTLKAKLERELKDVGEGIDERLKSIKETTDMRLEETKNVAKAQLDALGKGNATAISDAADARLKAVTADFDNRLKQMTKAKASTEAKDRVRAERDRIKDQIRAERDAAKKNASTSLEAQKKRITEERDRKIDALKNNAKTQSDALTKNRDATKDALTKQLEDVKERLPEAKTALDAALAFAQRLQFMQARSQVDATAANAARFERQKQADANPFSAAGAGAYGALKSPADFSSTAARVSEMRAAAPTAEDIQRGGPQAPTIIQNNITYYPVPDRESAIRDRQAAAARNLARR